MLYYKYHRALGGHPTLYGDEEERRKIANDPLRSRLWEASADGDRVAQMALRDFYEEHGIYERKSE